MWSLFGLMLAALTQLAPFSQFPVAIEEQSLVFPDLARQDSSASSRVISPRKLESKSVIAPMPTNTLTPMPQSQTFTNNQEIMVSNTEEKETDKQPTSQPIKQLDDVDDIGKKFDRADPVPTATPTTNIPPTTYQRPTNTPKATPFPDPIITIVPESSIIVKPPKCPSIPPRLTQDMFNETSKAEPINCLD